MFLLTLSLSFSMTGCEQKEGKKIPTPDHKQDQNEETQMYTYNGNTPVYVVINSHNEDTWGSLVGSFDAYKKYRSNLIERLQIIAGYGAKLNWQTDHTVIEAMIAYEGSEELLQKTNGMNILQYIDSLGFSIDPHTHSSNFADVTYLIEQLDVKASPVIGGIQVFACGNPFPDYLDWHANLELEDDGYVHGRLYPEARWKPEILSGAAFGGHWYDDYTSGAWRPGNKDAFYEHDKNNQIIYIGQGYAHDRTNLGSTHASGASVFAEKGAYIKELVQKITTGEVPSGKMYTALVHVRDKAIVSDSGTDVVVNEGLRTILEELKPLQEQGLIVYVTYQEAAEIWKEKYNEEPNQLGIENFSMYDELHANAEEYCDSGGKKKRRSTAI